MSSQHAHVNLLGCVALAEHVLPDGSMSMDIGVISGTFPAPTGEQMVNIWFLNFAEAKTMNLDRVASIGDKIQRLRRIPTDEYLASLKPDARRNKKKNNDAKHDDNGPAPVSTEPLPTQAPLPATGQ